jgi:ribosomal protein S18 acetylase RimI-like enzyme
MRGDDLAPLGATQSGVIPILDNIIWNTLSGAHKQYSVGTEVARRYAPGFSPIIAFADALHPDFESLAPYCEAGAHFYCDCWSGPVPDWWTIDAESTMFRMVWDGRALAEDLAADAAPLGPEHSAQAAALAALTNPGPFGPRTLELGDYFGFFDGPRLIAMAGERFQAGELREISGVCTHPDYQGRGLARRLVSKLVHRQTARNERPFLHVMRDNARARNLYATMGFREYQETVVRILSRK